MSEQDYFQQFAAWDADDDDRERRFEAWLASFRDDGSDEPTPPRHPQSRE